MTSLSSIHPLFLMKETLDSYKKVSRNCSESTKKAFKSNIARMYIKYNELCQFNPSYSIDEIHTFFSEKEVDWIIKSIEWFLDETEKYKDLIKNAKTANASNID